jgi:hypothetical protein
VTCSISATGFLELINKYKYNTNTNIKIALNCRITLSKYINTLPDSIKSSNHDIKVFKPAWKDYLLSHSLYCIEEFTSIENY